jgi:hypothetical protein
MTNPVETQLSELRGRLAAAHRARGRAEQERDAATAAAQNARVRLAEEFGVHTAADADRVLAELQAELDRHIAELRAALEQIEQTGGRL